MRIFQLEISIWTISIGKSQLELWRYLNQKKLYEKDFGEKLLLDSNKNFARNPIPSIEEISLLPLINFQLETIFKLKSVSNLSRWILFWIFNLNFSTWKCLKMDSNLVLDSLPDNFRKGVSDWLDFPKFHEIPVQISDDLRGISTAVLRTKTKRMRLCCVEETWQLWQVWHVRQAVLCENERAWSVRFRFVKFRHDPAGYQRCQERRRA